MDSITSAPTSVTAPGCGRYSTNKAGMQGLDKETVLRIIHENSKGSKFYENELRRERNLMQQIEQKLSEIKLLTPAMIQTGEKEADRILATIDSERHFARCIVHLDMDAYYAAVEIRDQPELRFKPVAVGSNSMLSTSNYIARRFGVRPGLPGFLGKKLCPNLVIVPPDFARYTAASQVVRGVLREYVAIKSNTDLDDTQTNSDATSNQQDQMSAMVTTSLDEAYLDLTYHLEVRAELPEDKRSFWPRANRKAPMLVCRCPKRSKEHSSVDSHQNSTEVPSDSPNKDPELSVCQNCGLLLKSGLRVFGLSAWEAVREIRFRVFCATRLTCSAGIGPNTLVAKIASDWCKPCGQFEVGRSREEVNSFMQQLPVRKVPGIGHVTERRLEAFGIQKCEDLIAKRGILWHISTRSAMTYYLRIAIGHSQDTWLAHSKPGEVNSNTQYRNVENSDSNHATDRKSMSVERTFGDTHDPDMLFTRCRQLAASLSADLKEEHIKGRLLTMKLKLDTFEVRTRSQTLPEYTNEAEVIATFGCEILRDEISNHKCTEYQQASSSNSSDLKSSKPLTLRLMGLRMSNLLPVEMCPQIRQRSIEELLSQVISSKDQTPETHQQPQIVHSNTASSTRMISSKKQPNQKSELRERPSIDLLACWTQPTHPSATSPGSSAVSSVQVTCPVCNTRLRLLCENDINRHLDDCLSRATVAEVLQKESHQSTPESVASSPKISKRVAIESISNKSVKKRKPIQTDRQKFKSGPIDKFMSP